MPAPCRHARWRLLVPRVTLLEEGIGVRVLIAVSEQRLAALIGRALKQEGYSTEVALDGELALDRVAEDPPFDLLILDIALTKRGGLDVLKILRDDRIDAPALVLTAGDATDDVVRGLNLGADATLAKPFVLDEFLARARALLRRRSAHRAPVLQSGDLILDPAAHRVTRSGRRIALTAREYAVLEYLLRNPGQALTREMIAEHVWGRTTKPRATSSTSTSATCDARSTAPAAYRSSTRSEGLATW